MNYTSVLFQLLSLIFLTLSSAQLHYYHQPADTYHPHYHLGTRALASSPSLVAAQPEYSVAHPSVVANSLRESELPSELLKSERFYKNPHIAAALAKESWFTDKEMPVIDREAEKIPRDMIFKIFHNAGWIKRR